MSQWYYVSNGEKRGPVSADELKTLTRDGRLTHSDKVWRKGMAQWQPAARVKGLFDLPPEIAEVAAVVPALIDPPVAQNLRQLRPGDMLCLRCGAIGRPTRKVPGSIAIELVLWLCFIVPGLLYSLWRLTATRKRSCPSCGGEVIPLDSPEARLRLQSPRR